MVGVHLIRVWSQIAFLLSLVWQGFDVFMKDCGVFINIVHRKP